MNDCCYFCGKKEVVALIVRIMQPSLPHVACSSCKEKLVGGGYMVVENRKGEIRQ